MRREDALDEIARMRDAILKVLEDINGVYVDGTALAEMHDRVVIGLRDLLDPAPTQLPVNDKLEVDPERLDEAMHRRDTYAQRAEANRARFAEGMASAARGLDHAQAIKTHLEAQAVQRDVDARLSSGDDR